MSLDSSTASLFCSAALLLSAACAVPGIGSDVVEVARATSVAGEFHVEFDEDGRVVEAAGAVPLDSVPAECRAAVDSAHPGGRQTGAERVYADGETSWMVAKEIDGRALEILVDDDGDVTGGEEVLARSAWPAAVVQAAQAAVPGAALERVERVFGVEARGDEAYHVKLSQRGESVRVGVSERGEVVRVVRRLAGQVRVPR